VASTSRQFGAWVLDGCAGGGAGPSRRDSIEFFATAPPSPPMRLLEMRGRQGPGLRITQGFRAVQRSRTGRATQLLDDSCQAAPMRSRA